MSRIEEIYRDWTKEQTDGEELQGVCRKVSDTLEELLGFHKFNEIDNMIMKCVQLERLAAFKGGFQRATEIWKECC